MTAAANKQLAESTWTAIGRGDVKAAFANLTDDVTWSIPGLLPISGVKHGKEEIVSFLRGIAKTFPEGLKSEIRRVHATDDAVIMELTNRGKAFNGKAYENEYCFVFEIQGGKIRAIREYVDTQKAAS